LILTKKSRVVGIAILELDYLPIDVKQYCDKKVWKNVEFKNESSSIHLDDNDFKDNEENIEENDDVDASDFNDFDDGVFRPSNNKMKRSAFLQACCFGSLSDVQNYYEENHDALNDKDKQGSTPFILSGSYGRVEVAEWLLSITEWNFNEIRQNGTTAFIQASLHGHINFLEFLLKLKSDFQYWDIRDKFGDSAVMHASRNGHMETIVWLVDRGTDIFTKSISQATCLHRACVNGDVTIIKFLVESGLNINAVTVSGNSPLHYAVRSKKKEAVLFLLEKSPIVAQNHKGFTPLDVAKKKKDLEIIELLENFCAI